MLIQHTEDSSMLYLFPYHLEQHQILLFTFLNVFLFTTSLP